MGTHVGYPVFEGRESGALVLLYRCLLLCSSLSLHPDVLAQEDVGAVSTSSRLRFAELFTAGMDLDLLLEVPLYAMLGLSNLARTQQLLPVDLPDPTVLSALVLAGVLRTRQFDYDEDPIPVSDSSFQVNVNLLRQMTASHIWNSIISNTKRKFETIYGYTMVNEIYSIVVETARGISRPVLTREEILSQATRTLSACLPPSIYELQYLNTCTKCGKVESEIKQFKMCSGCKGVRYCSQECQVRQAASQAPGDSYM